MRAPLGILVAALVLSSAVLDVRAQPAQGSPRVGDSYEITLRRQTSQQGSDGSSGSSQDTNVIVERVVGVRADGLELEYDFPKEATAADRASTWQFPVRVFRPSAGPKQLLNRPELEARIDGWLKKANWTRAVCGRWIFTWTAFRIDCDPETAIKAIEPFDLRRPDLRDGASYEMAEARGPGTVVRTASGASGETFVVELAVDPDAVRRASAESDVAVGEMMQKPVTFETALAERAKEAVSGTILVTFDTDPAGGVRRRTTVSRVEIREPDGRSRTQTVTETVERERLSGHAARR